MKGYRTLAANVLAIALMFAELGEWTDVIPPAYMPYFALGLAMANVWLRLLTTTPVGRK